MILAFLFSFVVISAGKVKIWLPNTSFNNTANWDVGRLPCKTSDVVFPKSLHLPVELPDKKLEFRSLTLSDFGYLVFPKNGAVSFTDKTLHASCEGGDVKFTRKKAKFWADASSWSGSNEATPHVERVPCSTDEVVFPSGNSFYVRLPDSGTRVSSVTFNGKKYIGQGWLDFLKSDIGSETFTPSYTNVKATNEVCERDGCECDNGLIEDEVCLRILRNYKKAECDRPVLPIGFCFPICGAQILYGNGIFREIEKELKKFVDGEKIIGHVSRTQGFIQVVLLEKSEYSGFIQETAERFNELLLSKKLVDNKLKPIKLSASGLRISKTGLNTAVQDFIKYFLFAILAFALIFIYYQNSCEMNFLDKLGPRIHQGTYDFARFENQTGTVEVARERLERCRPPTVKSEERGFGNPMFTEEAETNETMRMSTLKNLTGAETSDSESDENEENVEILNGDSDNSDQMDLVEL